MKRLKLFFACLLMAVLSIGQVWATSPATITFSELGLTNQQQYTDPFAIDDNVTITFGGGANDGKYYDTGAGIRTYGGGTITINAGSYTITEAAFTWDGSNKPGADNAAPTGYSTSTGKWTGSASSIVLTRPSGSGHWRLKSVTVTYSTGGSTKTLTGVTVSGTPTTTSYENGNAFNPAGLVVTGTYDIGDPAAITSGITWTACKTEGGTYVALDDEAVALAKDETGIYVKATVSEITSPAFHVTGLTVTAAQPKITIDGSATGITTTDEAQTITAGVGSFGGTFKQLNTTALWFTSGTGYIYNTESFGYIRKITINYKSGGSPSAYQWIKMGSSAMNSYEAASTNGVKYETSTGGSSNTFVVDGDYEYFCLSVSNKNLQASSIVIEYDNNASAPKAATPTFPTGDENFVTSTSVTLACTTEGAKIYYTTNGDVPTSSSTLYNGAIPVSATTTIKAIAVADGMDNSNVAEKTFTKATVLTPAEALAIINGWSSNKTSTEDYYVAGIISQIDEVNENSFATYYISADGTTTDQLQVYKGLWVNGANFTSTDQIQLGDEVTVKGKLKKYNSYKELDQNNKVVLYLLKARLSWSGALVNNEFAASLEGANTFPTLVNSNSVTVEYSSSNTDAATINASTGAITLKAVGSTTITASFAGNPSFKANSVSYTLNVSSSVIKADISFECNGATSCPETMLAQSNLPSPLPTVTKAGKNFGGWFTDSEFNTPAVAGAAVASTDPITLYAKWLDPYTVAEALAIIDALEDGQTTTEFYYVAGEVTSDAVTLETGSSATYKIKDAGEENSLTIYKGKGKKTNEAPSGEDITEASYLQESDAVILYGQLQKYVKSAVTTPEVKSSYIYSLNRPEIAVTGVTLESTASVAVGKTINLSASVLPANATNKTINWSVQSGSEYASVADGVVTGIAEGTAVVRATSAADATKYAECTVTVAPLSPWASVYTSNVTLAAGSNAQSSKVRFTAEGTQYDAVKAGTGKAGGSITVTVPAQATALHLHVVGWSGENPTVTITAPTGVTVTPASISATADAGLSSNSPFTLQNDPVDQYLALSLSGNTEEIELTFSTDAGNKRFALYGVNQEGAVVLESISITGEATALEYNDGDHFSPAGLGVTGHYSDASTAPITEGIVWAFDPDPLTEGTTSVSVTATVGEISSDAVVVNGLTVGAAPAPTSGNVVIIAEYDSKFYAMTNSLASGALAGVEVEKDGSKIVVASQDDKDAIQWTATVDGDNTTLKDANDKYIKGGSSASLSLEDDSYNWNWNAVKSCYISSAYTTRGLFFSNSGNVFKGYALTNLEATGYAAIEVIEIDPANIVISSKVNPELAYTPASDEITVGDAWSAPSLGYVEGFDGLASISYESSNEAVATVSDAGVIALAGGTGTATITATFGGNTNYLAGSATYTITVNAPAPVPTGTTYTKVTSTENITDGEYLIVYEGDATHAAMAFNGSLDNIDQSMVGVAVTINEGVIAGTTAIDAATFTIDVTAGTLQSASGYYIGRETYDNGMDKSTETAYTNTFAISEGNAVITGAGNCTLRYNYSSDQLRFRYYKSGQQAIQLYKKDTPTPDYTRTVTVGNYGTICLPNGGNISGAKLFDLEYYDGGASTLYLLEVEGNAMVAGRPYIFLPSVATIEVFYTDDADADAGSNNGLIGWLGNENKLIAENAGNYILYQSQYWFVNSTAYVTPNHAYIHMDDVPTEPLTPAPGAAPRRRVAMAVNGENAATGFENIESGDAPMKVMIEGTMYILRGEKVYDATGRLVK